MARPSFLRRPPQVTVGTIAALTQAELIDPSRSEVHLRGVAALEEAGPRDLVFFDNLRYAAELARSQAGACLVGARLAGHVPAHITVLRSRAPFRAFVEASRHFYEEVLRPRSQYDLTGIALSAIVHPDAMLEDDVIVDPLAIIGPGAEIGSGTMIGSGAVIGSNVRIGRDASIGANVSVQFALIGNNVILHPGCNIGQDGFGFTPVAGGKFLKVPQLGRVIIQNEVEIGSGTCIDRGSLRDTVIGEGTKIDNQVQIGHNVQIGRHCVIAGQSGLAGSCTIGDHVLLGARAGINTHVRIGNGAQVGAMSGVMTDVPDHARYGGVPAKPNRDWFREVVALERLGRSTRSDMHSRTAPDDGIRND